MKPSFAWSFGRVAGLLVAVVGATVPASASAASAEAQSGVIATLVAPSPIAAGEGWVLWSEPTGDGRWSLVGSRDGVVRSIPVAPSAQPFDISVGTDAHDAPAAVYSRCTTPPARPSLGIGAVSPSPGGRCHVEQLELSAGTGSATTPGIPHPDGASDSTPAIHHGRIAFGRFEARTRGVEQVRLWTPGSKHLRALPTGSLPKGCTAAGDCHHGATAEGAVEGLSFDGRRVAFLWRPSAANVAGDAAWELRSVVARSGASTVVARGGVGEACSGASLMLTAPVLVGPRVTWIQVRDKCYVRTSTLVEQRGTNLRRSGLVPGSVLGYTGDATQRYALEAQQPAAQAAPTCSQAAPCEIRAVDASVKPVTMPRLGSLFN